MISRLAWATDIHLNHLHPLDLERFIETLGACNADAYLLTGDIAEAPTLGPRLRRLAEALGKPIYFVLGNHDYYFGSIARVREEAARLTADVAHLHWLPAVGVVELSDSTALVGHGGWGDGREGAARTTPVRLNDSNLIEELTTLSHSQSLPILAQLGQEAADALAPHLSDAVARFDRVIVATHVPPFRQATWHEGELSNDQWLPFFCCGAMGQQLLKVFEANPQCMGTVLCGHTHSQGRYQALPNLKVVTGKAVYGAPVIADVIDVATCVTYPY